MNPTATGLGCKPSPTSSEAKDLVLELADGARRLVAELLKVLGHGLGHGRRSAHEDLDVVGGLGQILLDRLLGDEADAALPARGSLVEEVVDAELVLVLDGKFVELLLEQDVGLLDVGVDKVDLGLVGWVLERSADDLEAGGETSTTSDHAEVTRETGSVSHLTLGALDGEQIANLHEADISLELEGASIKIALPATTNVADVTHFHQILSQYAAYQDQDRSDAGTMELMDEDGKVLGVVQGFTVHESDAMSDSGNEKAPVLIDLPPEPTSESEKQNLEVDVLSAEEKRDWLIRGADTISRTIIKASEFVGDRITGAADSYMAKRPPAGSSGTSTPNNEKTDAGRDPVKIGHKTHAGVRTLHGWSGSAVQVSSKTTGAILRVAGNVGDKIGKTTGIQRKVNPDGTAGPAPTGIRGFVNRSLIAANTVLDGIDAGAQTLLYTSGQAASNVVGHKYGDDARELAEGIGGAGKNVFIVYKDVRGIRRSALLKAARSRVMKAKLDDGREVTIKVDEKGQAVASSVSAPAKTASEKSSSNPPPY